MIEVRLAELRKKKVYFENYAGRSGCAPCDRSEADYQLRRILPEIDELERQLKHFGYV